MVWRVVCMCVCVIPCPSRLLCPQEEEEREAIERIKERFFDHEEEGGQALFGRNGAILRSAMDSFGEARHRRRRARGEGDDDEELRWVERRGMGHGVPLGLCDAVLTLAACVFVCLSVCLFIPQETASMEATPDPE